MAKIYVSRTGRRLYTVASDFRRRNDLPYGKWTCSDGREVLFNRFYEPIWHRCRPAETPEPTDPTERVPWETQEWFYDDGVRDRQKIVRGEAALTEWGIEPPPKRFSEINASVARGVSDL
jgi:hypothetical protein